MAEHNQELVVSKSYFCRVRELFNWTGQSSQMLRGIEKKIFSYLKTAYRGFYVDIGPAVGEMDKIWTISMNPDSTKSPLVLLHGLGAGVALWVLNLDEVSKDRPVYAIDVLGFGRSSRPNFSTDALTCEKQFVKSIEEWRREMSIDRMILLGHSMGGFLASSYAIAYPERIKHLILADPWGFPEKPSESGKNLPLWVKAIAIAVQPLNPFWAIRAAGPFGQWVVERTRPDITRKFSQLVEQNDLIPQYIHQCNSQTPSGEAAFHVMMESYGWAKNPMINRIQNLDENVPITCIYGSRSWMDISTGETIKTMRPNSFVNNRTINGAGHHVYADKPEVFNQFVNEACIQVDQENNIQSIENNNVKPTTNKEERTESDSEEQNSNITENRKNSNTTLEK